MSTAPEAPRIAVVTDVHHGWPSGTMPGDRSLAVLEGIVERLNALPDGERPHLLVEMGDRIMDRDRTGDLERQAEVAAVLSRLSIPRYHLLGNHDVATLSAEDNAGVLGQPMTSASLDLPGWHLVLWRCNPVLTPRGFNLAPGDLEWLEADLACTKLPSVVFTHAPFSGASVTGNYYFENFPELAGYADGHLAREVVERHQVALCVSGHLHWTSLHTSGGVHHLTVQAVAESYATSPHPAEAWAIITLGERIDVRVHGRQQPSFSLPVREPGRQWRRMPAEDVASVRRSLDERA
ncbi:MAG TPA: metallophosphoesterase [Deinococcales bacterium]|nr:metallophosphoesterase [Deinococcales bacterium]